MAEYNFYKTVPIIPSTAGIQKPNNLTTTCFNNTLNDGTLRVPLAVFYSLFFLFGSGGNMLALWVFLRIHSKKNSVRIFLINLALADLVLMTCLPFRVVYHANNNCWNMHPVFCRVVGNVFYMNMYVSIFLLGVISIDRYVKLQKIWRKQRFLSRKQSILTCCLLWVTTAVFITPLIVLGEDHTSSEKCFEYKHLRNAKWKAYINIAVVFAFWVVYGTLVTSYGKIAMGLLQISKEKPDFPNAAKYSRTARKSFFVLFLFTLCFVPYHIVRIFYIYSQITDVSCQWIQLVDKMNELSLLLSAFNSCLDPVMYFVLCSSVRRTVLQILQRNFCQKTSDYSSSSYDKGTNQREQATQSNTSTL
ncbi:probable G-protein coupled receptor 34 isoform X1 [Tachysurus vachellii]|uniref:probable G-protein coupled receptor 34 isoform X1 n=1 Tax=Tachysurus vachellii TaxID=175792 RepID=UPI00296AAF1C|nr:probable G-protein coupled receptor 34 isoform X1 [Tachysurus vachellii]